MKISLDRKILGGFLFCCLTLLVVAIISYRNSSAFLAANEWVTHTQEVISELEQMLVTSVEAENSGRGFVITGQEEFLLPFQVSKEKINGQFARLYDLTKDNPAQQRNIANMERISQQQLEYIGQYIAMRQEDIQKANAMLSTRESRRMLNEIRQLIHTARGLEQELLAQRKITSEKDANDFNVVFLSLLVVLVLVLVIVYMIISTNLRALRKAESETADKNWTLEGTSELIRGMQGNKSLKELSNEILSRLTKYLDIPVGALYVAGKDNSSLDLTATYALRKNGHQSQTRSLGSGIAGQAAWEKRTLTLSDIKSEFRIDTSFGQFQPRHIIAFPFLFENKVIGVIELGTEHEFSERKKQYLNLVADSIAIAITSSISRQEVKDLLEETQRQAEELETQQFELKQANEELLAKTELLERSEKNLRIQTEQLQQTNVELEEKANMLEDQKQKLQDAKTEIEHQSREVQLSSRYKSEFLANMSHELRTPLNSILILAQLLAENKGNRLGEKEIDFARNIHTSGNGLLSLINEILDLSKIEAGKMELDIEPVPIGDVVSAVTAMFSGTAASKSINFHILIEDELTNVNLFTDRQRIEQILRNLLSNAFKFTPQGGTVSLTVNNALSSTSSMNKSDAIAFRVTDTGIGIPKEKRGLIFEAFQQADGSTKRKYGGTGLGLSISRELSHVLGGEIHLDSEESNGSTFTLYVPLKFGAALSSPTDKRVEIKGREPHARLTEAELPEPVIAPHSIQAIVPDDRLSINDGDPMILILEDDEKFAQVLLEFVHERGYKGVVATQGNVGVSFARHYKPVAILLDIGLPVMDGSEVLRQIKNDPELRHIPVQIISAHDKKRESMALGAFDYIRKPVTAEQIRTAFDRVETFTRKKLKKLLIVEDDEQHSKAICELIGNGDVKSFAAFSGEEAYTMLQETAFDCIILDLGLPDISGFELMEKIRANEKLNKIPIVVYTGRDLKKDETQRLHKLADTVVLKTANSQERLLDETILFLHRVESRLPKDKQSIIRKLHKTDEILKGKRILLVDDDIRNIYSLTNALEDEGLICLTADNGKMAVDIVNSDTPIDLVLMDIMMPEMDGYEATLEIRKLDQFKKLPIIALTAKAMKGDKEKCLAVGMSDYVSKPVDLVQLLSLLRVWLYK